MNKIKQSKENSMPLGLTQRVGAIERLIQTFDAKQDLYGENHFKNMIWETHESNASWIYMGFSAIERLI